MRWSDGGVTNVLAGFHPGWSPSVGDRVLVAHVEDEAWVVTVLAASSTAALVADDGSTARLAEGQLELRDPAGRLVARTGARGTTLEAATGDLVLRAPAGRVRVEAGLDLELRAERDVVSDAGRDHRDRAARALELSAEGLRRPDSVSTEGDERGSRLSLGRRSIELVGERFALRAKTAELAAGTLELLARAVTTKALQLTETVGRYERTAESVVERAKESLVDVTGLAHTRVGRLTTIVSETLALRAKRSELVSEEDTVIDGRKVLLG